MTTVFFIIFLKISTKRFGIKLHQQMQRKKNVQKAINGGKTGLSPFIVVFFLSFFLSLQLMTASRRNVVPTDHVHVFALVAFHFMFLAVMFLFIDDCKIFDSFSKSNLGFSSVQSVLNFIGDFCQEN